MNAVPGSRNFGNGLSIQKIYDGQTYCSDCGTIMDGNFVNRTHLKAGICSTGRWWNISGGYGGGGASCGLGGGGGSGFTGIIFS